MVRYLVAYNVNREGYSPATATVTLTDGYTQFEDIRQIVAIRRGVARDEIDPIAIERLPDNPR